MAVVATKLIKDGNSTAVRIPQTALAMSGLGGDIEMEVSQGMIILRPAKHPRAGWKEQMDAVVAKHPDALESDPELDDWDETSYDGLDDEPR